MNILTFDIEEWFHILDNGSTKTESEWKNYPARIYENTDRILSILKERNQSASFFVLGWIAKHYPDVVKKIVEAGYEIGSHTQMHQLIYEQSPKEFKNDVEYSIKTLEDISGKKVRLFRAPGFSITERNKWAFEILNEVGINIDCSIFPSSRAHGGFPSYKKAKPSILMYNGIKIKELPINTVKLLGKDIIFSGGGYFRLFPYFLVKKWTQNSDYLMSYLHPRDFDYKQPVIKELSFMRKLKSYVGLKEAEDKLRKWIKDFEFIDIRGADDIIDWKSVPVIEL
jgi:polysaccharide deacetylase family protein (PEP-CTERM system associated)